VDTIKRWTDLIRAKPTSRTLVHGNGYFYILSNSHSLAKEVPSTHEHGVICEAFLERWKVDVDVDTRVAILQGLGKSQLLQLVPLVFLDMVRDGLNDYTTNARGDVGSHVRVEALRAVKAVWSSMSSDGAIVQEAVGKLIYGTLRLSAEKLDRVRPEAQAALALLMEAE
jgi:hypothetical protein